MSSIEVTDRQAVIACSPDEIRRVVETALRLERRTAELSIVLVDDADMEELNRRFLDRQGVTDVLAFPYDTSGDVLEGEIIANAELAARRAADLPHGPLEELLLYVVHGTLHLLGYDDHEEEETRRMRAREQDVLNAAGYTVQY